MKKMNKCMGGLFLISFLLLAFNQADLKAQHSNPGPQIETFYSSIDNSEQPYSLFLPLDYDPDKTYPLVIMLHGAWANHRSAMVDVFGKNRNSGTSDLIESFRYYNDWYNVQYIVAAPFARGTNGYKGIPEDDVMRVIEECKHNFNIDENRIFLTGLSMGGGGTVYIGLSRPSLFAAIAPVCPAPPQDAFDLLGNALNLPVAFFQGGADFLVKPEGTRRLVDEMREEGARVEYTEYPEVGHNAWDYAYKEGAIFKWFDNVERNNFPNRVKYATKWYKYNSAYWVLIDKMTPGTLASIDAQFTAENVMDIKTRTVDAFTLCLKDHPGLDVTKPLSVTINGQKVTSSPKYNHSFLLSGGKWIAEKYAAPLSAKRPGQEGPMSAAITSQHVYIYGTGGNPSEEELKQRMEMANQAADFKGSFAPNEASAIHPRVMSDKQYRPDFVGNANLILFGTKETNSVIASMSDKLPIQLDPAKAKEYGLVYCYPVNGKYVVVCQGIPFWTTKPPAPPSAPPAASLKGEKASYNTANFFTGPGARALIDFKDFLLFKGTNDQVVCEGYFDHDWKLPSEAISAFNKSQSVILSK